MANPDFDIAILGTGPVGCALALGLAQHSKNPERIALIGTAPNKPKAGQVFDPRALAMNYGSRQFLQQLGAWPDQVADILNVHVSQAQHLGQTIITNNELKVPQLGSVVTYDNLLGSLFTSLTASGISHIAEKAATPKAAKVININTPSKTITTRLVIISHGAKPAGIHRSYNQQAVLGTIKASQPQPGYAYERFTEHGPLALLPHPDGKDLYSLVWCLPPDLAASKMRASTDSFELSLQQAFGTKLGQLSLHGQRFTFALDLYAGPNIRGQGLLAIGNAAQTMHPVAGQGLNLGLRDAAQLIYALTPWLAKPEQELQPILQQYAKHRRFDRYLTMSITDTLPRVLSTKNSLVKHLGGLGLLAIDNLPLLRRGFARHLLQGQRI